MSIKEDLKAIKGTLSAEESMIEGFIKGERFFRKYKFVFLAILAALVVWLIYSYTSNTLREKAVAKNNELYIALLNSPDDSEKLANLKAKNPNLYVLFLLSHPENAELLEEAKNLKIDPLLKEILEANTNADSKFLSDYNKLLQAYELLAQDKIEEANLILAQIPVNSELKDLVNNFKHYKGIK
jgi:hypothetical protein